MILKRLTFGKLETQQDMVRALRLIEQSQEQHMFLQATDPGAVGAGKMWVTAACVAKVRNADNSGWITI